MKLTLLLCTFCLATSFVKAQSKEDQTVEINKIIDSWHEAAAAADFEAYFKILTDDAIFIGTDATENWTKKAFQEYAKPYFDKGKAWNFTPLQRNIYFSKDGKMAWFDELLDTQMKICRGSGVLTWVDGQWKIVHYVLSMSIPNELSSTVIEIKTGADEELMEKLRK